MRAEQNAEEPDYSRPLHDHSEDNNTVSEEIDDLQMASSSEPAETRIEAEGMTCHILRHSEVARSHSPSRGIKE